MHGHETLIAWQRARSFVILVFRITNSIWKPELAAPIDQLRRSALSLQLNIAEGYALRSNGLYTRHLNVAYGSAVESVDVIGILKELTPAARSSLAEAEVEGRKCCAITLALKHSVERRGK